jgi:hypothetical protein
VAQNQAVWIKSYRIVEIEKDFHLGDDAQNFPSPFD